MLDFIVKEDGYRLYINSHTIEVAFRYTSYGVVDFYVDGASLEGKRFDVAFIINWIIKNPSMADEIIKMLHTISYFKAYTGTQKKWVTRLREALESNRFDNFNLEKVANKTMKINKWFKVYDSFAEKFFSNGYAIVSNGFIYKTDDWYERHGCLVYDRINEQIILKKGVLSYITIGRMMYKGYIDVEKFDENCSVDEATRSKYFNKALENFPLKEEVMPIIITYTLQK